MFREWNVFIPVMEYVHSMNGTLFGQIMSMEMRVLFHFIDEPNRERYLEDLLIGSRIPKTTMKRTIDRLVKKGILLKRSDGYRTFYKPLKAPLIRQMKIMKNLDSIVLVKLANELDPKSMVLYGSRANGTDAVGSDWDILLIGEGFDAREVNASVKRIEDETGEVINVMMVSQIELASMRDRRTVFYLELLSSHQVIRGTGNEL